MTNCFKSIKSIYLFCLSIKWCIQAYINQYHKTYFIVEIGTISCDVVEQHRYELNSSKRMTIQLSRSPQQNENSFSIWDSWCQITEDVHGFLLFNYINKLSSWICTIFIIYYTRIYPYIYIYSFAHLIVALMRCISVKRYGFHISVWLLKLRRDRQKWQFF